MCGKAWCVPYDCLLADLGLETSESWKLVSKPVVCTNLVEYLFCQPLFCIVTLHCFAQIFARADAFYYSFVHNVI